MPSDMIDWLKSNLPVLFKDAMPVWLTMLATIVTGLLAAIGTYELAPAINRQYQIDEARSIHLTGTTKSLNEQIIALSQKVRRLNDMLVNDPKKALDVRQDCLDLATKLQWMLVDLRVVLKSESDRAAVDRLAVAIGGVREALDVSIDARAQPRLLNAMRTLGEQTTDVLDRLYVASSLK